MAIDPRVQVFSQSKGWVRLIDQPAEVRQEAMRAVGRCWSEGTVQQLKILAARDRQLQARQA